MYTGTFSALVSKVGRTVTIIFLPWSATIKSVGYLVSNGLPYKPSMTFNFSFHMTVNGDTAWGNFSIMDNSNIMVQLILQKGQANPNPHGGQPMFPDNAALSIDCFTMTYQAAQT
eukprot:m51a1_g14007 hypothetical protein (115) ;mRNA; f:1076358-1076702